MTGAGFILLVLGAIGIVVPVWPTTPFMLAAVGCLAATPKLQAHVMKIPVVSEYIRNYRDRRGIPRATVVRSLIFLWGMLGLSMALVRTGWVVGCLALVGAAVTAHILWVSKPRE